jgi:hypothetical protein
MTKSEALRRFMERPPDEQLRLITAEFLRRLAVAIQRDDHEEARELWQDVSGAVPEYLATPTNQESTDAEEICGHP